MQYLLEIILKGALGGLGKKAIDSAFLKASELSKLFNKSEEISLLSEQGIDYSELRDILAKHKLKKANDLTCKLLLKASGSSDYIPKKAMSRLPISDLKIIDYLWLKYSKGKFGFSKQKEIWESLRKQKIFWIAAKFCNIVGWSKEEKRAISQYLFPKSSYKQIDELDYSLNAPEGHLPCLLSLSGSLQGEKDYWLLSALITQLQKIRHYT